MTRDGKLVVAVVNNMPDSGLRAAERQYCSLLTSASGGMNVELKFFSPEAISRSEVAQAHIARYYDDPRELQCTFPDGIIVTGAEPSCAVITDEPFWPWLSQLVEWSRENSIPAIWTCLAAHAAVFQLDGLERERQHSKLSGVFDCRLAAGRHHVVAQVPRRWRVPHSRTFGLNEADLVACGYSLLSKSQETGPDIFVKQEGALQLFLQGHLEYEAKTLAAEYRRDVGRFLSGQKDTYPSLPIHYWDLGTSFALLDLQRRACLGHKGDLLGEVESTIAASQTVAYWSVTARRIYRNWLAYLASRDVRIRPTSSQMRTTGGHLMVVAQAS
jgi:homoserine O-succinyltransferase